VLPPIGRPGPAETARTGGGDLRQFFVDPLFASRLGSCSAVHRGRCRPQSFRPRPTLGAVIHERRCGCQGAGCFGVHIAAMGSRWTDCADHTSGASAIRPRKFRPELLHTAEAPHRAPLTRLGHSDATAAGSSCLKSPRAFRELCGVEGSYGCRRLWRGERVTLIIRPPPRSTLCLAHLSWRLSCWV
jgi:hypothetical protein